MTLNVAAFRSSLDAASRAELEALGQESDPSLAAEAWLSFAARQERSGRAELAAEVYANLAQEGSSYFRQRAQARLDVLMGGGSFGERFEAQSRNFLQEAANPAMLVGMGAAATVFSAVRLGTLSRLLASPTANFLTRGAGARILASSAALVPEVGAFWGASRLTRAALGGPEQAWDAATLTREWASLGLSLGLLKIGGWASRGLFDRIHGVDVLMGGATRLSAFSRFSRPALENLGMFSGIALAYGLEPRLGLAPERRPGSFWSDTLATLLQFHVGGRLSQEMLGPRYAALMQEMTLRSHGLEALARDSLNLGLGNPLALATAGGPAFGPVFSENKLPNPLRGPTHMMAQSLDAPGDTKPAAASETRLANGSSRLLEQTAVTRLVIERRVQDFDPNYFDPENLGRLLSRIRKGVFSRSEIARISHARRRYLNERGLPTFRLDNPLVRERSALLWFNTQRMGREPKSERYRQALAQIHEAERVLSGLHFANGQGFPVSPFRFSPELSRALGIEFYFLNDAGRETGSFKERGALIAVRQAAMEGALHVVAASHGNHGLAVSLAAQRTGLRSTIVVPDTTPEIKIQRLRDLGALVVTTGEEPWRGYEEARDWALRYVFERNLYLERSFDARGVMRYIHGFEDVIPGQGVAVLEILDQIRAMPQPQRDRFSRATFLSPTGGGGLAAGVATVLRRYLPDSRVISVVSEEAPAMHFSLIGGRRSEVFLNERGLCDSGIGLTIPGAKPFELLRETLDGSMTVSDAQVAEAMRLVHRHEGLTLEGGAAVGVAALLSGSLPTFGVAPGDPVVTIFTGGNIDAALHQAVLAGRVPAPAPDGENDASPRNQ